MDIINELRIVAKLRKSHGFLADLWKQRQSEFRTQFANLITAETKTKAALAAEEDILKAAVLAVYEADKGEHGKANANKKPFPGTEIKLFTETVVTYDAATALAWAKEKGMCLSLNVPMFEGIMKAMTATERPEWVKITAEETPKVQLATDIPKTLTAAGVNPDGAIDLSKVTEALAEWLNDPDTRAQADGLASAAMLTPENLPWETTPELEKEAV